MELRGISDNMNYFEIFFSDLTVEAQEALLSAVGIHDPKELNWDVFPVAVVGVETIKDVLEEAGHVV